MIGLFRKKPKITFLGANLLLLFCTVLFNEWAVYILWPYYYRWPRMECGGVTEFYKILFVADPQILGERDEWWIARWDSDRYLTNTFSLGLNHVKPDLIVFLGDLMDEGTIASSAQYSRYIERFTKIFSLNNLPSNMTVFLPGDNDIGGEDERVTKSKVTRFNTYFSQPSIINLGDIQFIKVNKMEHTYPKVKTGNNKTVRVIVSHVPLLGLPSWFSEDAIITLKPNMIFSAHDHKSVHFAGDRKTGERILAEPLVRNDQSNDWPMTWRFQLTTSVVNEVLVPTCSYRMGTYLMGYGAAIIDKRGEALCYSVLKLPQRFLHLYFYLLILTLMLILMVRRQFSNRRSRNYKKVISNELHNL